MARNNPKPQLNISINAPQGFLLNGKIVPSVSSNNLTVAIKTLSGNNPSALEPVFCRIGDTVRSITSALSVTKNAGTNWFNAGSAELATKEIDYFVYLGYNATDGVVIGFSRIPYAKQYSEFSITTTNDKYCAISTITNASANDNYEVVGRFASTLSAGAGYTWTVPTFTPLNLIQHPIFETRWLTWYSTLSTGSGITWTRAGQDVERYQVIGRGLEFQFGLNGNLGAGTATSHLIFTLPMTSLRSAQENCFASWVYYGQFYSGDAHLATTTTIRVFKYDGGTMSGGANAQAFVGGRYEI